MIKIVNNNVVNFAFIDLKKIKKIARLLKVSCIHIKTRLLSMCYSTTRTRCYYDYILKMNRYKITRKKNHIINNKKIVSNLI